MNTSSPATHGESRKRKFVRDVGIYAIGNIGAKLITFLMFRSTPILLPTLPILAITTCASRRASCCCP